MSTIFGDQVEINGVVFNDPGDKPAGIGYWKLDELLGWDSTPSVDFQSNPIGGAIDGEEIAQNSPIGARHVIVGGYVTAEDRMSLELAKDILWRDVFPRGSTFDLTRNEPVSKFLTVRVSGEREFAMVGPLMMRWRVPVTAGDPFKYGSVPLSDSTGAAGQSSGGRTYPKTYPVTYGTTGAGEGNALTLVNEGNIASTRFTLTLTGPLAAGSWRISNETTGEDISFDIDVASTDSLVIDFRAGVASLNGFPVGSSIVGDFFKLETGTNIIKLFADYDPAVSITATGYSAWE